MGCAVACVAFVTGLEYSEALSLFKNKDNAWLNGYYCKDVRGLSTISVNKKQCIALFDEISSVQKNKLGQAIENVSEKHAEQCKVALDILFFNYP